MKKKNKKREKERKRVKSIEMCNYKIDWIVFGLYCCLNTPLGLGLTGLIMFEYRTDLHMI